MWISPEQSVCGHSSLAFFFLVLRSLVSVWLLNPETPCIFTCEYSIEMNYVFYWWYCIPWNVHVRWSENSLNSDLNRQFVSLLEYGDQNLNDTSPLLLPRVPVGLHRKGGHLVLLLSADELLAILGVHLVFVLLDSDMQQTHFSSNNNGSNYKI